MKILHTADWHIRDKDIDECRKVLGCLIDAAQKEQVELIVIAGDLTDRNDVKLDSETSRLLFDTVSALAGIAPVAIVTGTPSHEGNIPEILSKIHAAYEIRVSTKPEQYIQMAIGGKRVLVSAIPTPTKQFFKSNGGIEQTDQEIGAAMSAIFAGFGAEAMAHSEAPHVLIGHFQVGGAFKSATQQLIGRDIEVSADQIRSAIGVKSPIFYSGSIYRKDFGELDQKGFWIHGIQPGQGIACLGHIHFAQEIGKTELGKTSRFVEVPTRKLAKIDADFTLPDSDVGVDMNPILYTYSPDELKDSLLRVEFRVWQDQREKINKEQIEQFFFSAGCQSVDVRIIQVPRQTVRAAEILKCETLRSKLQARSELNNEVISESTLLKADSLESMTREKLIAGIKEASI